MIRSIALLLLTGISACAATLPLEVWLTARPEGQAGKGTVDEPFNVSNPKRFSHCLNALQPGTIIHLAPGVYPTFGAEDFALKSGQHLLGAGMGRTILKLIVPPKRASVGKVLSNASDTDSAILVSDLTVDCNYQPKWGKITVDGVGLTGSGHTIRKVECVNGAGFAQEAFLICINAYTQNSRNNLIEGCRISSYRGGRMCTAISLINNSTLANSQSKHVFWTGGIVQNNWVDMGKDPTGKEMRGAFGGGGTGGALYTGNTVKNATLGFNHDTCSINDVTITSNVFNCSYTGINFRSQRAGDFIQGLVISNNTITLDPAPDQHIAYGIVAGGGDQAPATNVRIEKNTIRCTSQTLAKKCVGLYIFSLTDLYLENNFLEPGLASNILEGVQFVKTPKQ